MKYLALWLEAPLQSWGSNSKFGRRDTEIFPTKSGIYGLILSAMGKQGPQDDFLARLSSLRQYIIAYSYNTHTKPDILMDFHMVGSGYDASAPWERLLIPKKADGTPAVGGGSKITYRYYLQDVSFGVIQEMHEDFENDVSHALQFPVYDLFLGRKNCVPTEFIYRGCFNSFDEAKEVLDSLKNDKGLKKIYTVEEVNEASPESLIISDVPLQFGDSKMYKERIVLISHDDEY
ncbi:type I-E CRISPR-associated protein Cas5/CasD [Parasphaerochaeta coccoides]|uniref:CRISPR-associated protein Cas5 family n=1 Tax=Parasphaerochaeta coccoides (strain ATCC BAA-1237 / DSM 17374 / SPN1) TaxID=760011 RepID=F4GL11_PARC1|nr:type I-E CRISPR-associated protein Cas5/CasD [Parasphaerochaeta coccoides]AEC02351.1 CRISPR-associated protein Cas5 family [Parasphaerochaeta coccoides DSM 17374]